MEIQSKVNYGKLKDLVKAMSKQYIVKVGLLANKGGSKDISENLDIAGLGAVQEFGCDIKITEKMAAFLAIHARELGLPKLERQSDGYVHIPARSFLQMPLTKKNAVINELRKQLGGLKSEDIADYILRKQDFMTLAVMLGASAVAVVNEAFKTGGWGQWEPDSPLTIALKGSASPLRDTGDLQEKITYEVENG